jgi:dihydrofolate synthase/folylpolyglutamate synthase
MGGRLDATNIITPEVCVITPIGHDHSDFLGKTLREIAGEKAGIIKKDVPVVTAHQDEDAMDVILTQAKYHDAILYRYGSDFSSRLIGGDTGGIRFHYHDEDRRIDDLYLPLAGSHQMQNAALAIKAVGLASVSITDSVIKEGLSSTHWPGRLEYIHDYPPVIIDGAHNPHAAAALSQALQETFLQKHKKMILILGIMHDKDIHGILKPLVPLAWDVIFTRPSYARAASPDAIARIAESMGFRHFSIAGTIAEALDMGMNKARDLEPEPALIVITGSFYTTGEAREVLGQKGVFTSLRE